MNDRKPGVFRWLRLFPRLDEIVDDGKVDSNVVDVCSLLSVQKMVRRSMKGGSRQSRMCLPPTTCANHPFLAEIGRRSDFVG